MSDTAQGDGGLTVDFVGELHVVREGEVCTIGRSGTIEIDDNPHLHRTLLQVFASDGLWWVANVGSRLAVHLTDTDGLTRTVLAPGAQQILGAARTLVTFQAGPTSYELELRLPGTPAPAVPTSARSTAGDPTIGPPRFTPSQLLVILALAEPTLRRAGSGAGHVPALADAAARLGWARTRFNRKLDNVCAKLEAAGVEGLRGGVGNLASNRRAALVQHAVGSRLITEDDLHLLDEENARNSS